MRGIHSDVPKGAVDDDDARAAVLERYGVLDAPAPDDLTALTALSAQVCRVPLATINLITVNEQIQVATYGFEGSACAREDSMCARTLTMPSPVIVPDARRDPRFADNPFVTGEIGHVRFYASHRLVSHDGVVFGTLCVFDTETRKLDEQQAAALGTLAARVVDVLELVRRNRELDGLLAAAHEAAARLSESNERLAAFAGQVAHDLRNPLSAVLFALELTEEKADAITLAASAARRMNELVESVLSYAVQGGEPVRGTVDLHELAAAALDDLEVARAASGAEVQLRDLPAVSADGPQMRSVLQNLLSNALVHARPGSTPRIVVRAVRGAGCWRVEVQDDGPGVPADQRERVFDPLVRLAPAPKGGHGIGLATCRRIVEAHGGVTGLDDAPGGGAIFWFTLPDVAEVAEVVA